MKPLAFIIGQDSLLNFPSWYQYETILENSHLLVCRRPGYPLNMRDAQHQQWLDAHLTDNIEDLHSLPPGKFISLKRRGLIFPRPSSASVSSRV